MLEIFGIIASLLIVVGGFLLARSFFFSKKTAINLGLSRVCGSTDEENEKLPLVQFFLKARRDSVIGFSLIVCGVTIQITLIVYQMLLN